MWATPCHGICVLQDNSRAEPHFLTGVLRPAMRFTAIPSAAGPRDEGIVVRIDHQTRTMVSVIVGMVAGVFVVSAILSFASVVSNSPSQATAAGMAVLAVAAGTAHIFSLARSRVALHPECIEVTRYLRPTVRVPRSEIVARRSSPQAGRRWPYDALVLRNGSEVKVPPYLEDNAEFERWLQTVPLRRLAA